MKKTYITQMPDQAGAFMEASRVIANAGANITRVSYNKAVDMHTLFIDVCGEEAQLLCITQGLERIGYIQEGQNAAKVMLLEFRLPDVPGAVLPVLEAINRYRFNISYINSQENGTPYQNFKMGLFVERPGEIKDFLHEASALCDIRVIDYDESEKVLDNTVFYLGFAGKMAEKLHLNRAQVNDLIAQSNLIMQLLDERNEPPYKTFDYIGRFADMLWRYKADAFCAEVEKRQLRSGLMLYAIEPPCGSNMYILQKDDQLLMIDSGFACYEQEMLLILRRLFPAFDSMRKDIIITHPDMDHCGLLHLFDRVYVGEESHQHFLLELQGQPNHREQYPAHAPYCRISRIFSGYQPPEAEKLVCVGMPSEPADQPIRWLSQVTFGGVQLDVYSGNGGHAIGEVVIVDEVDQVVFSGDVAVNIHGFSPEQAAFNRLAPYLMSSVNMDSAKAALERHFVFKKFPKEIYIYCCGHGAIMNP